MNKKTLFIAFICCFFAKILSVFYFLNLSVCSAPRIEASTLAVNAGDTFSYIGAMENYIQTSEYYFLNQNPIQPEKVFAGRMPHYASVYFVLRFFFDTQTSSNSVVLLQILLESISIIILSLLAMKILKKTMAFWLCFFLMLVSLNITNWSYYLVPESFSASLLIFFVYAYYEYLKNRKLQNLTFVAIFLALLVVLKAYFVLFYLLLGVEFIFSDKKIKLIALKTFLVSLPFLILTTPWIVRNYRLSHKFIPLQENTMAGYWQSYSHIAMNKYLRSWGGNVVFWEVKAPSYYFMNDDKMANDYKFPSYAISDVFSVKDLENIRNKMLRLKANYDLKFDKEIGQDFEVITKTYQEYSFFHYRIKAPFIILKEFVLHSGSYYLPINNSFKCYQSYQFLIKFSQSALYYFSLIIGFIGLIWLTKKEKFGWLFLFSPVFLLIFFPFIMRTSEWRYFILSYPFLILGSVYLLVKLGNIVFKST